MNTYLTLDGEILDLRGLSSDEQGFLARCYASYCQRADYSELARLVNEGNPVLLPGRRITAAVLAHPLYRATRDLADRLGIIAGVIGPEEGDQPEEDPFADEWLSPAEAAGRAGVSVPAVYAALERGVLMASGDGWGRKVSARSVSRWEVNAGRQKGGVARQARRTAS